MTAVQVMKTVAKLNGAWITTKIRHIGVAAFFPKCADDRAPIHAGLMSLPRPLMAAMKALTSVYLLDGTRLAPSMKHAGTAASSAIADGRRDSDDVGSKL